MSSTRQQIIAMLQTKKYLSAQEISRALQLTPANIRHHLGILEEEGVIEVVNHRKTRGRGRPIKIFTLTQQAISHNLDGLASALLEELSPNNQSNTPKIFFARIASRLAQPEIPSNPSLTKRLFHAIQRLNDMHYQARWEAHADAPRIYLEHCPYAAILPDHPELCLLDANLLNKLLDHPVTQTSKLERDNHGMLYCLFTAVK